MMELFRSGKLLREIVAETGAPINTVRYWTERVATPADKAARRVARKTGKAPRAYRNEANQTGIKLGDVSSVLAALDVPTREWVYRRAARTGSMTSVLVDFICAAYRADPAS